MWRCGGPVVRWCGCAVVWRCDGACGGVEVRRCGGAMVHWCGDAVMGWCTTAPPPYILFTWFLFLRVFDGFYMVV